MKTNKKLTKRIFIGLGAATSIVAPIASSVAFAAKAASPALVAWQNFYKQVNDVSKDQEAIVNWSPELILKLTQSHFYKEQTNNGTNRWNITNGDGMFGVLHTLQQSNEFTDIEKVAIGKRIIGNQMCADIFENFGFSGETTTNAIVAASGKLIDPSKNGINFIINNQEINLMGTTGENTTFRDSHIAQNEHEYNFSNQDILNYYLAAMMQSQEFKNLTTDFATTRSNFSHGTITFKNAITDFYAHVNAFLSKIATSKLPIGTLLNNSIFNVFTNINMTVAKDEDEAYNIFMNSPLAKQLYPNGEAQNRIDAYKAETDADLKKDYFSAELGRLNTKLIGLTKITSPFLNKISNNSDETDKPFKDTQAVESAIKFAKTLADYSNNFTSDVQLLVYNDPIHGYAINIKTGHTFGAWSDISDSKIDIPYFVMGDSNWNVSYGFKQYAKTGNVGGINSKTVVDTTKSIALNSGGQLNIDHGGVMGSGSARGFYLELQFKFNGINQKPGWVWLYENDHDNDSAVKHQNWTTGFHGLTWSSEIASPASDANAYFYRDTDNNSLQDTKPFTELISPLNSAIKQITNDIIGQVNGTSTPIGFTFDPLARYTFVISLDSIKFGNIYFNTYDDSGWDNTHADYFRFTDVSANFSYKIIENKD